MKRVSSLVVLFIFSFCVFSATIPNFTSVDIDSAKALGKAYNVTVVIQDEEPSPNIPKGCIIKQVPSPGTEEDSVSLIISGGKRFCPYCGTLVSAKAKFCPKCGKRLSEWRYRVFDTYPQVLNVAVVKSKGGGGILYVILALLGVLLLGVIVWGLKMRQDPVVRAKEMIDAGDEDGAIEYLRGFRRQKRWRVPVAVMLAELSEKRGLPDVGIGYLEDALRMEDVNEGSVSAFYKLGLLYEKIGEVRKARDVYRSILTAMVSYEDVEDRYQRIRTTPSGGGRVEVDADATLDKTLTKQMQKRYELVRKLGEGGMGIVYEAKDTVLDRPVALKVMREEISLYKRERERFLREAKVSAKLTHPNIVEIYDVVEEGDNIYLVFEYIDGKSLKVIIDNKGRLGLDEALRITVGVCGALEYAHKQGVIHRDVKPSNIMVRKDGWVKVLDFGIARVAYDTIHTFSGKVVGTFAYMAPEQHLGEKVDPRTDVYGVGVMVYEVLTGELPFRGGDLLAMKREKKYTRVRDLNADVPEWLEKVVDRCLEPNPKDRFANVGELRERVQSRDAEGSS